MGDDLQSERPISNKVPLTTTSHWSKRPSQNVPLVKTSHIYTGSFIWNFEGFPGYSGGFFYNKLSVPFLVD